VKINLSLRGYNLIELLTTRRGWVVLGVALLYWARPVFFLAARLYRRYFVRSTRLVAVVGTLGKSTTTRLVTAALGGDVSKVTEFNAGVFLAWKIFQIRPGDRLAVIEVGITRPGQMRSYARLLRPDVAVVTTVGSEHNRSLGSLEATREQKSEMVRALPASGLAVLNGDDPQVRLMARETKARVVTFGLEAGRDVFATHIRLDWPRGTQFTVHIKGLERTARTRLIGRHQVYGVLAAVALAAEENIPLDEILERLEGVEPTPGRLQPVRLDNGAVILRDEYKSTMESVEAAFATLGEIKAGRRLAVLGEIGDPRGSPYPYYRWLGRLCAQICDKVIFLGTSSKFKTISRGVRRGGGPSHLVFYAGQDVLTAAENLLSDLRAGDVVLIKGRVIQKMMRISLALLGRRVRCRRPDCRFKMQNCGRCPSLDRP
jgi:UDP-N-acetylmuramyl pentapeptide synthase